MPLITGGGGGGGISLKTVVDQTARLALPNGKYGLVLEADTGFIYLRVASPSASGSSWARISDAGSQFSPLVDNAGDFLVDANGDELIGF
jgi:hypothetical protein